MPIGYYNFGNIQQGNQQVVNSMAGLGQQISHAIETHAATQSAKAMLPMLQQQYASGMQKIANGEQGGMADVIQAATLASQNPLTAGIGNNMIAGMQQASHMANTQAYLQGTRLSSMATHPEMYNPDGTLNTNRLGQAAPARPMTAYQQGQLAKNIAESKNNQINEYGALYAGDSKNGIDGIGTIASRINEALKKGEDPDAKDLQNFASMYGIYKQKQSAYGKNAVNNTSIDQAFNDIKGHLTKAKKDIDQQISSLPKGTDPTQAPVPGKIFGNYWHGTKDLSSTQKNLEQAISGLDKINSIGSEASAGTSPSANSQDALILSAQKAIKNGADPKAVQERLNQLIQQMKSPAQQSAPAMPANQPNSQIPAASGAGDVGTEEENPQQQTPVEENESED
jgi:hypothetical protein